MDRRARLDAIIAAANPEAAKQHAESGTWPGGAAPYVIDVHREQQRIRVTSTDGDQIAGVGATKDGALDMLETKLKLTAPEGEA